MSFGIVELITVLMGIAGFGVGTNPKAPTAEQALEYAIADADIVAHLDAGSLIPGNYKVLTNLPNQPQIKASPELAKAVRKVIAEVDGPRGLFKGMTDIDLATDISDATAFLQIVPKRDPSYVVQVHGKFSVRNIERMAKAAGKTTIKAGGSAWFDAGDGNAVAVTKGGVMLVGSTSLVKDRVADTWKAPALTAGTNMGNAAEVLGQKPVFALVVSLSQTARAEALANLSGQNFLTDVIKRHKSWSFAVHRDGISWSWIDSSKTGLDAMAQMSEGVVDILRAAQIAPRGFAKIVMGAVESYRGNKQVDELIRRKADIWKIVDAYTGDGQFKAQIDKDPKTLKLSVRLTGKSLSEVVPLGGLVPFGAVSFLMLGREESSVGPPPPPVMVAPPPPPPAKAPTKAPTKKQGNPPKRP